MLTCQKQKKTFVFYVLIISLFVNIKFRDNYVFLLSLKVTIASEPNDSLKTSQLGLGYFSTDKAKSVVTCNPN